MTAAPSQDAPAPPEPPRYQVWCVGCRTGDHGACCAVIVVTGGWLRGTHRCACTAPHPPGNGILIVTAE